jgi:hypothetical protein
MDPERQRRHPGPGGRDVPVPAPEDCEALERNRPGGVSYEDYFRFLKQFHWTEEQLRAIPLSTGPRFTLD